MRKMESSAKLHGRDNFLHCPQTGRTSSHLSFRRLQMELSVINHLVSMGSSLHARGEKAAFVPTYHPKCERIVRPVSNMCDGDGSGSQAFMVCKTDRIHEWEKSRGGDASDQRGKKERPNEND